MWSTSLSDDLRLAFVYRSKQTKGPRWLPFAMLTRDGLVQAMAKLGGFSEGEAKRAAAAILKALEREARKA